MAGKQAKLLRASHVRKMLQYASKQRYSERNRVIILLSVKAGFRACEIAGLTWSMVLDARCRIADVIELHNAAAKQGSGRIIPIHSDLKKAFIRLRKLSGAKGHIIKSERGVKMNANSIVNWFACLYEKLNLNGCSSHSGRRTFITGAARKIHKAGGSLRDVQQLAGHSSIEMTQRYIEGDTPAKRRLVQML
ncbi:MAG: site-specific integrase [Alphaproteobacteria bacterium]|nr:site-specific integrase [Alphaproteobacteria bacterium]